MFLVKVIWKFLAEPAKRADSIKPGVERSGTQDRLGENKSPRSGRQRFTKCNRQLFRYRTLRALGLYIFVILGFRFAPPQALCWHPLRGLWSFL